MKKKISIIFFGTIIPLLIFFGICIFIKFVFQLFFKGDKLANNLLIQGIANVISIFVLIPFYISFCKRNKIKPGNIVLSKFYYLIPFAFSLCLLCNIIINMLPFASENAVAKELAELAESYGIWICIIIVSFAAPIVEELIFRGFIYDTMLITTNIYVAFIVSSVLFAVIHGNFEQGYMH